MYFMFIFNRHQYAVVHTEKLLKSQISNLEHVMSDQNLELLPDYFQRVEGIFHSAVNLVTVLKVLKFVDQDSTVQLKGRVACEINTADELIMTELILDNVLREFSPAEIVALLSCFVFQEKSQSKPTLTPNLERVSLPQQYFLMVSQGVDIIKKTALRVGHVQRECGLDVREEDALQNLKFGLVEVVHEWALGLNFKQITDLTDVLEGSIVRCIVRLEETCREVC